MLTRGLGRSYGDASLPPADRSPVANSMHATRVLDFDEIGCSMRVEAGLSLRTLADLFLPRGFFLPVAPGTANVTVGGMVAADVHGKNHVSAGSIGAHLLGLRLRLPNGDIVETSDTEDRALFRATIGGMGLTGHILDATLRLDEVPSRFLVEEAQSYSDFESLVDALVVAPERWPFSVAWADLLVRGATRGRGVLQCGRWASEEEASASRDAELSLPIAVPFAMPGWLLSNESVGFYNSRRYETARRRSLAQRQRAIQEIDAFFHPLDAIGAWNLLYGRRGMTQYQCVLPPDPGMQSYLRLAEIARSGGPGPFLVVIKNCGPQGKGTLSFPRPGLTFAFDYPVHEGTAALVARLNEHVASCGGRIYLAKDAFTTREHFAAMEPRLGSFRELRERIDPEHRIDSALARRLL